MINARPLKVACAVSVGVGLIVASMVASFPAYFIHFSPYCTEEDVEDIEYMFSTEATIHEKIIDCTLSKYDMEVPMVWKNERFGLKTADLEEFLERVFQNEALQNAITEYRRQYIWGPFAGNAFIRKGAGIITFNIRATDGEIISFLQGND